MQNVPNDIKLSLSKIRDFCNKRSTCRECPFESHDLYDEDNKLCILMGKACYWPTFEKED